MTDRTFLFTDIERSTRLWEERGSSMAEALARHDAALAEAVTRHGGAVLKSTGDGIFAAFPEAVGAVAAAVEAQQRLTDIDIDGERLAVRMGLHSGEAVERGGDYFGPVVNRAARIMAAGHGRQVLASSATVALAGLRDAVDLGHHRLPDLLDPEHLFQVAVPGGLPVFPPLRTLDAFDTNLPNVRTPLFGRDREVVELESLLDDAALVTLTGMGGVGKTRLALEVASRVLDRYDGVFFVDLAPVSEEGRVLDAVALALGLPAGAGEGADADPVFRLLASRRLLLILDNCEHLVAAVAQFTADALSRSRCTVLATSREPLGIPDERVWRVPSLDPDAAAVELFIDRAMAAGVNLDVGQARLSLVREICAHLDGIPLAVELAAGRTTHLSLADIAERLGERFRLLTGGRRVARQRQQTLKATLDWSYELLSAEEQRVLRWCATFVDGFTLPLLEAVTGELDAVDVLGALVDKSLVVAEPGSGETRYRLLETVRLYGHDRLVEEGEAAAARDAHARAVLAFLTGLGPLDFDYIVTPRGWELDAEKGNVNAALDWADSTGSLALLAEIAANSVVLIGVGVWVDADGRFLGRDDVAAVVDDPELKAAYLLASAANANQLGRFTEQLDLAERALELGPAFPRDALAATLLANALSIFDPARGREECARAMARLPPGEEGWRALLLVRSADGATMAGDVAIGLRVGEEAERLLGMTGGEVGFLAHVLGDNARALADADVMAAMFEDERVVQWTRYRPPLLRALGLAATGHGDDARRALLTAADAAERYPVTLTDRDILVGCAALAFHEGDHRRASWLLAVLAHHGIWTRSPGTFAVYRHYRSVLRERLSRDEVAAIKAETAGVSITDALASENARLRQLLDGV